MRKNYRFGLCKKSGSTHQTIFMQNHSTKEVKSQKKPLSLVYYLFLKISP